MSRLQRFLVVSLIAVFVATLAPAALAESYKFGASKPGGSWYPIGTVLQRLADKNYGDKVTVEIGGGTGNLLNVMSGKLSFGLASATSIQEALKGAKMFKGKVAQAKKVRVAAVLYPNYLFWLVWAKSDVTSYQQLKGKKVNVMPKRFSFQALNQQMLGALGIEYKDFSKVNYLGFNDAVAQMKDNHIDAYLGPGEENYAPIVQLATHAPIRILSFSKEDVAKMKAANAWRRTLHVGQDELQTEERREHRSDLPAHHYERGRSGRARLQAHEDHLRQSGRLRRSRESLRAGQGGQRHGDMGAPRHAGMDQYLKEKGLLK